MATVAAIDRLNQQDDDTNLSEDNLAMLANHALAANGKSSSLLVSNGAQSSGPVMRVLLIGCCRL